MILGALCGLIGVVASVSSAQNEELQWKQAISDLRGDAPKLRPNPFGGAPVPQRGLPVAGPQFVQLKAPPAPPPFGGEAVPRNEDPRPVRPVFTLPGAPKLDRHGDPLPAGAVARFGTVRLRHGTKVEAMEFTQDAKLLCTIADDDGTVRMWDTATGKEVARLTATAPLVGLARDGSAVVLDDGRVKVWLPATRTVRELPEKTLPEGARPSALAVNPDGQSFALATNGKVLLIDAQTGKTLRELNRPDVPANNPNPGALARPAPNPPAGPPPSLPANLLYSPDGRWLLGNGQKTGVWLWDLRTGKRVRTYRTEADFPEYAFSPDVTKVAITGERLHLYPLDSEEPVDGFRAPENAVPLVPRFAADGKTLFVVQQDGSVLPLDAATGAAKKVLGAPEMNLRLPFALAPGAVRAAGIDPSDGIRIWDPKTGKGPDVTRLAPLSDPGPGAGGTSVTVIDRTNKVHTFDLATGAPGKPIELPVEGDGFPATWDPVFRRAAALVPADEELELRVIDADTKKVLSKHSLPQAQGLPTVAFASANRDRVMVVTLTGVTVLNPTAGKTVRTFLPGPLPNGPRGAISPDGRLVAVGTRPLTVWEVATGKKRLTVDAVPNADLQVFSRDSRLLAVWDDEGGNVVVVDARAGTVVRRLSVFDTGEGVSALAISADGKRVAAGSPAGRVTVWDVSTGDTLAPFAGHEGTVTGLVFTADGKKLVSTAADGTALVWEIPDTPLPAGPVEAAVTGFDEAFRLLGSADAAQAQRGLDYLYRHPADAVKQAATRVPAPAAVPAAVLAQHVADLESDEFPTRERAVKALARIGGEAGPLLQQAVEKSSSAEVRKLATELLVRIDAPAVRADDLRVLRVVEALENLGTPEAGEQLKKWAAGPPGHRTTVEAAAALARLKAVSGK